MIKIIRNFCKYQPILDTDRLLHLIISFPAEKFLNLVAEKKYKYEAALLSYELMNYNEVESDDLEDLTQTLEVSSDGFLGAKSR